MVSADPRFDGRFRRSPRRLGLGGGDFDGRLLDTTIGLRLRLAEAVADHGLTRRELWSTQRAIERLERRGLAPDPTRFWASRALPRAERLSAACRVVIDEELERLATPGRSGRFLFADQLDPTRRETLRSRLERCLPPSDDLDALGRWWQRRLRRAAMVAAAPAILRVPVATVELVVARQEMTMLDGSPWAHGDRLLSAFELTLIDVRNHGRARIGEAIDGLAGADPRAHHSPTGEMTAR